MNSYRWQIATNLDLNSRQTDNSSPDPDTPAKQVLQSLKTLYRLHMGMDTEVHQWDHYSAISTSHKAKKDSTVQYRSAWMIYRENASVREKKQPLEYSVKKKNEYQ